MEEDISQFGEGVDIFLGSLNLILNLTNLYIKLSFTLNVNNDVHIPYICSLGGKRVNLFCCKEYKKLQAEG